MRKYLFIAAALGAVSNALAQTVTYDNTVTALPNFYGNVAALSASGFEHGDRVYLTGTDRRVSSIEVRYQLNGTTSGAADMVLRIYDNTPMNNGGGLLYTAPLVNLPHAPGVNTYTWAIPNVTVPSAFTWTIEVTNRTGSIADAAGAFGPLMFNLPAVGGSSTTFVLKNAGTWGLFNFTSPAVGNFGSKVTCVAGDPVPPAAPAALLDRPRIALGVTGGNGVSSVQGQLVAGSDFDRQHCDNFTVPSGGWTVGSVAAYVTNDRGDATAYKVEMYAETGPGGPPAEVPFYSVTVPIANVVEHYDGLSGSTEGNCNLSRKMRVKLPAAVPLVAGTYWIQIQPQSNLNHFHASCTPTLPVTGLAAHFRSGPTGFTDLGAIPSWPATWTATGVVIFTVVSDRAIALYGPEGNTVTGIVDFGNVGPTYNSGPFPASIPVSFRDTLNNEVATGTASYNAVTGAFSTTTPAAVVGPYRVSFKLGFWLRKTLPNPANLAAVGNYNFGTVAPEVGDADDDNEITNADYSIWAFGNGNSVAPNTDADFDGDGEITNSDYALWAGNNGLSGDN